MLSALKPGRGSLSTSLMPGGGELFLPPDRTHGICPVSLWREFFGEVGGCLFELQQGYGIRDCLRLDLAGVWLVHSMHSIRGRPFGLRLMTQ